MEHTFVKALLLEEAWYLYACEGKKDLTNLHGIELLYVVISTTTQAANVI